MKKVILLFIIFILCLSLVSSAEFFRAAEGEGDDDLSDSLNKFFAPEEDKTPWYWTVLWVILVIFIIWEVISYIRKKSAPEVKSKVKKRRKKKK
tara:strand:+ start:64 stop:345 length:282 start_codon:yes stop_codon:yes gene_type:complete